jgi:hypothetical protein
LSAISTEMVRIYKDQFGRGPTKTPTQWPVQTSCSYARADVHPHEGLSYVGGSKIPAVSAAVQVAGLLDSPEIATLVVALEATRWTGRPGYPIRVMVGMALAKSLYARRRVRRDGPAGGVVRADGERR